MLPLVVGLGNPLMGDDGVGTHLVARLHHSEEARTCVETLDAGTDLLRHAHRLAGRPRVFIVDAVDDGRPPGTVTLRDLPADAHVDGDHSAHQLAAVNAVRLLRLFDAALEHTRFTLVGVSVGEVSAGTALSPAVEAAMPVVIRQVLDAAAR